MLQFIRADCSHEMSQALTSFYPSTFVINVINERVLKMLIRTEHMLLATFHLTKKDNACHRNVCGVVRIAGRCSSGTCHSEILGNGEVGLSGTSVQEI